jgi:soluble lytic murein transglycosylase-like protein
MGSAPQYVFPGALFGSVILALFAFLVTAGVTLPVSLSPAAPAAAEQAGDPQGLLASEELDQSAVEQAEERGDCDVSENYPETILQWCELITHFSDTNGLDPDLIAALIWQESGGNPVAYSRSGAVGLMQVMPRDGLAASFMCQNGPCFVNRPAIADLQDPKFNIKYGTGMLAGLSSKYGDIREALKYYGPKDVDYYYADKVLGIFQNYRK